jgi:AraC-like DNA-binding protein
MVCSRCKIMVTATFNAIGIVPIQVALGEVVLENEPSIEQLHRLDEAFKNLGFERIDDQKAKIIERIKTFIIEYVHHNEQMPTQKLSVLLQQHLLLDYSYMSNLFSEVESITIEKYFIAQRIERVKELIRYDELTLSEIAYQTGYSSVAYLSNQFKKVTGLTPSYFKEKKDLKRRNLEEL